MKTSSLLPTTHLFVCANRRAEGDPLGPGCGDHGERVYAALKREIGSTRQTVTTWVTKTACLGLCPKHGATIACYRLARGEAQIYVDVTESEAVSLL